MRLKLLLPNVEPERFAEPSECAYGCGGKHFHLRQEVAKPLRDTQLSQVTARRYDCLRCGRTFRVYPQGVSADQTSQRLKGLAVMFYIMGLSYGAVSLVLEALGHPLGKTAVYEAVQAAGEKVPGLRREQVGAQLGQLLVAALGADLTSVKVKGQWVSLGVSVDAVVGTALTIDILDDGEAQTLTEWVAQVAEAVHAQVLVTDDADGFKQAADQNGLGHQVCKSHVLRNTVQWLEAAEPELARDADGSLGQIGVPPEQALQDAQELRRLIHKRQPTPEAATQLAEIHLRYKTAPSPKELGQERQTLAYRLRLFSLDRWNLWPRLTFYRGWRGHRGERLDGTNPKGGLRSNASERVIGWRIKERYRTMRGYPGPLGGARAGKRRQSVLNVSRLIAWAGNLLSSGGADLAVVVA
jgi:transposase-like protein